MAYRSILSTALAALVTMQSPTAFAASAPRHMERLDRGVVAAPAKDGGVLVSWRLLGDDAESIAFNVYRNGVKLNARPVTDSTNFVDSNGDATSAYTVRAVVGGREQAPSKTASVWSQGYLSIPLQKPADGVTPVGDSFTYTANDASVGDLDGDGRYEIILK